MHVVSQPQPKAVAFHQLEKPNIFVVWRLWTLTLYQITRKLQPFPTQTHTLATKINKNTTDLHDIVLQW